MVMAGIRWTIGNGQRIRFWWDHWVPANVSLSDISLSQIHNELVNKCVADFVTEEGLWN